MDDAQLMDVLRQMQQESEELEKQEPAPSAADSSRDYIRAKLDTIRRNVRAFQAQQRHSIEVVDDGLSELSTSRRRPARSVDARPGRSDGRPPRRGRRRPPRGEPATRRLPEPARPARRRRAGLRRRPTNWSR